MTTITCARPGCGVTKHVRKQGQRYCSHRCDILDRGAAALRVNGRLGGVASGESRWARSMSDWRAIYPQVPPALARAIYLRGYNAGATADRKRRKRAA